FNQAALAEDEVRRASEKWHELNMKTLRTAFLSSAVLELFSAVAIAAVAIYVGFDLLGYSDTGPASRMTWFRGLAVLMLAPRFFRPLRTLSTYYHERATATGAAAELARYSISGCLVSEKNSENSEQYMNTVNSLRVAHLNVNYAERGQVLYDINLE